MIKLFIVGVPIDYRREDQAIVDRFKSILLKAKRYSWPVYAGSTPDYFRYLTPDGWKTIESIGLPVYCLSVSTKTLGQRFTLIAEKLYKLSQTSTVPIISLHPGNPKIGDTAVRLLLDRFKNQDDQIAILKAKSGVDIVGDMAEKSFNKKNLPRQYMNAKTIIELKNTATIHKGMLLVYCISGFYDNGNQKFFSSLIIKLFQLGLGDRQAYIKSPGTKGMGYKVIELMKKMYKFNPADHYTLAIFNDNNSVKNHWNRIHK